MMWMGREGGATAGVELPLCTGVTSSGFDVLQENPLVELKVPNRIEPQACLETSPTISPQTLDSIKQNPALYTCRVLRREVEGRERVLLILGECHRKSEEAGRLGESIIAEFNDIGCEGSVPGSFARVVATITAPVARVVRSVASLATRFERGSSIDDAETIAHVGRERINYATEIMLEAEKRGLDLAALEFFPEDFALPVNEEVVAVRDFPGRVFMFGNTELRGDDIVALARSMADRVRSEGIFRVYEGERRATKRTYCLEAGYRAGVIEALPDLYSAGIGALMSWGIYSALTTGSGGGALHLTAALGALHILGHTVQKLMPERTQDALWFDWFTGVTHAFNFRRDGVMTENIGRMFERNPVCTKALCIVGAAHVGPVATRLVAQGWRQEFAVYEPNLWSLLQKKFS